MNPRQSERPILEQRFGRFVHRKDPLLIARVVGIKRGENWQAANG